MMGRARAAIGLLVLLSACNSPVGVCRTAGPADAADLLPAALTELSGLVWFEDALWAVNDGSPDQLWRLDASGNAIRTLTLSGAQDPTDGDEPADVEDLALDPDAPGGATVLLADVGDEDASRPMLALHRVLAGTDSPTAGVETVFLQRPSGTYDDIETLLIDPRDGTAVLISRTQSTDPDDPTDVDEARVLVAAGAARAEEGETVSLVRSGTLPLGDVTGGDVAADASVIVLRTSTQAWIWTVNEGQSLVDALQGAPCDIDLNAAEEDGEGIAITPTGLALAGEGEREPLYTVALTW